MNDQPVTKIDYDLVFNELSKGVGLTGTLPGDIPRTDPQWLEEHRTVCMGTPRRMGIIGWVVRQLSINPNAIAVLVNKELRDIVAHRSNTAQRCFDMQSLREADLSGIETVFVDDTNYHPDDSFIYEVVNDRIKHGQIDPEKIVIVKLC